MPYHISPNGSASGCFSHLTYNGEAVKYDADGNMTYGPLDGVMTEFTYDCRNRLIKAGDTTYEYDAENTRIAVKTSEYREEYVVNTNTTYSQVLNATRTYNSGESVTTIYTYGIGLVSQYEDGRGTEYYHYDNLGSTTYLTKDGVKTKQFAYGTYGELILGHVGEIRFLYNGRFGVMTDKNNLYYMRARYYNVDIKRFINQDIITGEISNSQSLNRYAYCQGNPVNYMDPFGLSPENVISSAGHAILNVLGMLPGGEVFDIINAIWYTVEGKSTEAIICLIGGLPFLGNFAGAFNLTKLSRGLRFSSNVGKVYMGGKGAIGNLNAMWDMYHNGTGHWYDYMREGGMLLLNMTGCAVGTSAVMDDLSDLGRQIQKIYTQNYAGAVAKVGETISAGWNKVKVNVSGAWNRAKTSFKYVLSDNSGRVDLSAFGGKGGRISNLDDGLNFSKRALEHMGESGRQVPIQTLQDAIRYGEAMPDPRGSNATMYYTTMYKNGKMYNLEVLYDEISNTVYHFEYARKAMGNLPAIPK